MLFPYISRILFLNIEYFKNHGNKLAARLLVNKSNTVKRLY